MSGTAAHRPYKFINERDERDERPDGYDAQKHFGRRPSAGDLTREANRRERHKGRATIAAEQYDDLAPRVTGRHSAVCEAY